MIAGLAGIGVAAGLGALVRNMQEAEKATAQLDAAFKNTGKGLGLTRDQLDDLANSMQRTTTFSDDLVKEGEAILLTFSRVRGEAFERTIRVAGDLSARLGTDLKSSIRQVGLALQDPVAGLTLLRRSGIAFSESQKNTIKGFLETNQAAKAQELILRELEKRFAGSAAAARNTLGGALTGLKNAFGDLFEGNRESTSGLVKTINDISTSLANPEIKKGLDNLIAGLGAIAGLALKVAAGIGTMLGAIAEFGRRGGTEVDLMLSKIQTLLARRQGIDKGFNEEEKKRLDKEIATLQSELDRMTGRSGSSSRGRGRPGLVADNIDAGGPVAQIEEINITVRKLVDENGDLLREMRESTRTEVQRISGEFIKLKETLRFLRDLGEGAGGISEDEFQKRLGGSLDDLLPEFDLNEIRAKYITLKRETSELGEFMKGVWQGVGRSIQSTLSDAIFEWNLSWKSLIDIARRALADVASAIITSGIKGLLKDLFKSSSSSSDGLSQFFGLIGGAAAGAAGGGRISGATIVGEDGPELLFGRGSVMNKRQMAFAGMGGASVTYAPTFNLSIQSSGDRESERRMAEYVESRLAQSQGEFTRLLGRSGVEVKG